MVVARTQCISIIDESSPSTSTHFSDWALFRSNYPDREFWLLQPAGSRWDFDDLNRPSNFLQDSLTRTRTVNRDDGNINNRSDWFEVCDLSTQPPGSYVSVWLDISGSMTLATVQASYDYFVERCNNNGINIILETSNSGERWIPGHDEDFTPSASFSADANFLTNFNVVDSVTIPYGGSATLAWIVFGDVTSATIDNGVGSVTDPSGTVSVSPTGSTTYTLTVSGPAGTVTREIDVTVQAPPPPSVTLSASPISLIRPNSTTLSWDVSGVSVDYLQLDPGNINVLTNPGLSTTNYVVTPNNDTTYTLTAKNFGGAGNSVASDSVTITVFEPAVIDSFTAVPNPAIVGSITGTRLIWEASGDISTASISPAITQDGNVLINSSAFVFPTENTTYTLTVSGDGGTDVASVSISVCQIPEISGSFPTNISYGDDFTTTIKYKNAASTCGVTISYTDIEGVTTSETRNFTLSASDQDNVETELVFESNIPWSLTGPKSITYALFASGCGGSVAPTPVTVNGGIDTLPDAVTIPDSRDQIPEDQVEAPDISNVLSDPIVINDIDIPVEIKASEPIQVRFDDDDPELISSWNNLREITD